MTLTERINKAASVFRYSNGNEHWVTLEPSGTHIAFDDSGNVVKGPDIHRSHIKVPQAPSWFQGKKPARVSEMTPEDKVANGYLSGAGYENQQASADKATTQDKPAETPQEKPSDRGAIYKALKGQAPLKDDLRARLFKALGIMDQGQTVNEWQTKPFQYARERLTELYRKSRPLSNQKSLFGDEEEEPQATVTTQKTLFEEPATVITKKKTWFEEHGKAGLKEERKKQWEGVKIGGAKKHEELKPGERWITLHNEDHGGGVHVKVNGDGDILAGPKALTDKGITNLSDFHKKDAKPKSSHVELSDKLADHLKQNASVSSKDLFGLADEAHGGTRAEGKYGQSEAYDSLEAAINKNLDGETDPRVDLDAAIEQAQGMTEQVDKLPTQTNRDGNKVLMQQFSTPPHYAYAVNWLANLQPGENVLEPSAGTGSLAVHAKNAGANVYVNELDPTRADFLRHQFGDDRVFVENAEQIAGILPGRGVPQMDAIVMNPPFSSTAGRTDKKDVLTGAKHIQEAAMLLKPNGRLVAIVGGGMSVDAPRYRQWFRDMANEGYDLRANVLVDGDKVYAKYGTKFDSRVLVFDKRTPAGEPILGEVGSVTDLMKTLEGVRNDRSGTAGDAGDGDGESNPAADGSDTQSDGVATAASGSGVGGTAGADGVPSGAAAALDGTGDTAEGLGGESDGDGSGKPRRRTTGRGRKSSIDERIARAERAAQGQSAGGEDAGGKPVQQSMQTSSRLRPAELVEFETVGKKSPVDETTEGKVDSENDLGDSLYDIYRPQAVRVKGAKPHPSPLVESAAMAAVRPPVPTYRPMLSPDVVEKGLLSEASLETVVYAGEAHSQMLEPNAEGVAYRRGYFLGDGTGTGKGRQLAGIILDNANQGRKKAVWITKSQGLILPTNRDLVDVGFETSGDKIKGSSDKKAASLHHFDEIRKSAKPPEDGTVFMTYDTLRSKAVNSDKTNLDTLVDWLGPDFDGVVAFDESHLAGNALAKKGARGMTEGSQRAQAVLELQRRLPNARVVYSSATGATEVSNLAYADRLGIWGKGTSFPDKHAFIDAMETGGIAAMEAVAQSLKATGSYCARTIAMDDGTPKGRVEYDRLTHTLDPDQIEQYDALADGWQNVLENIDKALEYTGGKRGTAQSQFWGAQQRFFNQVMTSMQTPAVIRAMEDDFAGITRNPDGSITHGEPRSPVIQLVNTMESATKKALASKDPEDDDADIDISPRQMLKDYLAHGFPTERYETYTDEDGQERSRPVVQQRRDEHGRLMFDDKQKPIMEPVHDPRAVALKEELIAGVDAMRIPEPPIDQIVNHFGHRKIAEVTGRSVRRVSIDGGEPEFQQRNPSQANPAEHKAFLEGNKQALIFSGAGNTGFDYHAGRNFKNQARRTHYMLQPGWRADEAVQGFGRTNRTNQSSAPYYRLVEIDQLKGQKRFISTIARRLDQLGALTKGQRATGGGGLFKAADNLESKEANEALLQFFNNLERNAVPGLDHGDVMRQMGLAKAEENARKASVKFEPPSMSQFLNRMLSMRVDMQGKVFEAFDEHLQHVVEKAMEEGTLDTGVENFPASSIERKSDKIVYQQPGSGAQARHIVASAKTKSDKTSWTDITSRKQQPVKFVRNRRSGAVWGVFMGKNDTDPKTGVVKETYVLRGPKGKQYHSRWDIDGRYGYSQSWEELDPADAKVAWDKQHADIPDYSETEQHFLTGALLPIWDRIPGDKPKVYRMRMEDGQTIVGRHIKANDVPEMIKRLGVHDDSQTGHTATSAHSKLLGGKHFVKLANGWKLKPVLRQGERRIQLIGPASLSQVRDVISDGVQKVLIGGHDAQYFVPTGSDGVAVIERLTKTRPISDIHEIEKDRFSRIASAELQMRYGRKDVSQILRNKEDAVEDNTLEGRLRSAVIRYARSKPQSGPEWITIGGHPGESGKHEGGTHVEVDGTGKILKGPRNLVGSDLNHPVPAKNQGEDEKKWLKRIVNAIPSPGHLPEQHDAYFNMDKAHKIVPMSQLRSTKSDEENAKGGGNAPKFMDLSRRGLTGKRDPITVRPNEVGGYDVVDGNGTFTGAKSFGWQNMPVQFEPLHPGEGRPPIPDATPEEKPHGKPFFAPEELGMDKNGSRQPIEPNAGYAALANIGKVADRQLHQLMSGIGQALGLQTYDAGDMTPEQMDDRLEQPGGFITMGPMKLEAKSTAKVNGEYGGDWGRLIDIARCTAVVDNLDQVHTILQKVRESGAKFSRRPKDRITHPMPGTNYRDVLTNIIMPNGAIVELQINLKPMMLAKKNGGHQLYDLIEKPRQTAIKENRKPNQQELQQMKQAEEDSRKLYDAAWEKIQQGEAARTKYARRLEAAEMLFYARKYPDAPGQKDLFTGEVRKTDKTQGKLRWITLHDRNGEGTTHVQITDNGDIKAGPAALKGRNLTSMGKSHKVEAAKRDPHIQHTDDGRPVGPAVRSIDDLHVDPHRFQYKISGIDQSTGTNGELKKVKEFNPMLGGQLLVWHDPADGKTYVVNGHHRAELAKRSPRSTDVGKFNGNMPVYYVDAKDHTEARAHGALANIAEGRGTATDAARFMRDRGVDLEDFAKIGVSPSGSVAAAALQLKKLSPTLFQKLSNGLLSEGRAAAIGKHLENHDAQDQLHKWIESHEKQPGDYSDRKVAEMARSTAAMRPKQEGGGGGLFDDFFEKFPIAERADIADHVARTLSGEKRSLRDASSERRAGVLEAEGDNRIDTAANRERAQRAAGSEEEFHQRANAKGHPIALSLDQFAERLANEPKKRASILKEALAHIRGIIEKGARGDDGEAVEPRGQDTSTKPLPATDFRRSDREHSVSGGVTRMSRVDRAAENFRYYFETARIG